MSIATCSINSWYLPKQEGIWKEIRQLQMSKKKDPSQNPNKSHERVIQHVPIARDATFIVPTGKFSYKLSNMMTWTWYHDIAIEGDLKKTFNWLHKEHYIYAKSINRLTWIRVIEEKGYLPRRWFSWIWTMNTIPLYVYPAHSSDAEKGGINTSGRKIEVERDKKHIRNV